MHSTLGTKGFGRLQEDRDCSVAAQAFGETIKSICDQERLVEHRRVLASPQNQFHRPVDIEADQGRHARRNSELKDHDKRR